MILDSYRKPAIFTFMSAVQIREKLHRYIDSVHEKKLKAIYTIVEDEIEDSAHWGDKEFLNELRKRSKSTGPEFSIQDSVQRAKRKIRQK